MLECATFRWLGCTRVLADRGSFRCHPSNSPSPHPFPATHGGNPRSSRISAESHIMPLWTLRALVDGPQSDVLRFIGVAPIASWWCRPTVTLTSSNLYWSDHFIRSLSSGRGDPADRDRVSTYDWSRAGWTCTSKHWNCKRCRRANSSQTFISWSRSE